jgi:dTDP-glucose pyrophosphorylase
MQPALLLLAAGMGSRYGGLKQLDAMGPSGQTMIDYAIEDALRAGFGKIIFVIRRDFESAFREQVGRRYESRVKVCYAFQELSDLPQGFEVPEGRSKPWGTAHAVRAARDVIEEPFAVINADDFYGREAYAQMADALRAIGSEDGLYASLVGYILQNTLSNNGSVNRGICTLQNGLLQKAEEYTKIARQADGRITGLDPSGAAVDLPEDSIVSMNFWGFSPSLLDPLESMFTAFLKERRTEEKSEFYLPSFVDALIQSGQLKCPVMTTESTWFGVTYPEDKPEVVANIQKLTEAGTYQH